MGRTFCFSDFVDQQCFSFLSCFIITEKDPFTRCPVCRESSLAITTPFQGTLYLIIFNIKCTKPGGNPKGLYLLYQFQ